MTQGIASRAREEMLSTKGLRPGAPKSPRTAQVRDEITTSWRRARAARVDPERLAPRYDPEAVHDSRLRRAALPVLDRLGAQLSGCDVAVVLANADATIVDRVVEPGRLARHLDDIMLAPGFSYAEHDVGTNGVGSALEQGRTADVVGSEHYATALAAMACVGVTIRDPRTARVLGVLDATAMAATYSPVMSALVHQAAQAIYERLYDDATVAERLLLGHFLDACRWSHRPVVALNERLFIQNPAAALLCDASDHAALFEQVRRSRGGAKGEIELALGNQDVRRASIEPVADGDRLVGELVVFDPPEPTPRRGTRSPRLATLPGLVGSSNRWDEVVALARQYARLRAWVVLAGEPGVGKLAMARAMHEVRDERGLLVVRDVAAEALTDVGRWIEGTAAALEAAGSTVVLRHVDLLDPAGAGALAHLLDTVDDRDRVWVVATTNERQDLGHLTALDHFPHRLIVPPLRERPADIGLLARHFVGERGIAPQVVAALAAQEWPGNARELREVLRPLCGPQQALRPVSLDDLPAAYRVRRLPGLTRLEHTERQAILDALGACAGNKLDAAQRLGISRATLYRKLRAYKIE